MTSPSNPPTPHDPYAALRFPNARRFLIGSLVSILGGQMVSAAIAWELYQRTHSATALGLVGLVQAIPIIALAIPAGHLADSRNRKHIVVACQLIVVACSLALAAVSFFHTSIPNYPLLAHLNALIAHFDHALQSLVHRKNPEQTYFTDPSISLMYIILFITASVRSFADPAKSSILPRLVPIHLFSNLVTWSSSGFQAASVIGPMLGGFLAAFSCPLVYLLNAFATLSFLILFLPIPNPTQSKPAEKVTLQTLAAGLRFVFSTQIILATITLDLFAVLLGGAVALLPMYADLLHVGPIGFGFLRAAPSVGALIMAVTLAHRPPMRHAGRNLLYAVAGFGLATIIFGYTPLLPDSLKPTLGFAVALISLAFTGVFDNVSVVVRHTLVQVLTPDTMRGRVSAVNNVFIGSSNELGALESGLTAAIFTPLISVVAGGIGTILVVLAAAQLWPQLRSFGKLSEAHPQESPTPQPAEI